MSNLIQLISDTDTLYTYTVQQLFRAIQDDRTQVGKSIDDLDVGILIGWELINPIPSYSNFDNVKNGTYQMMLGWFEGRRGTHQW